MGVFFITGHGAGDPGACGNGYQEYERVRTLAKVLKTLGGDQVMISEEDRNYYKDNGITKLNLSKDWLLCELHMDSNPKSSARGAHVIIWGNYEADDYDKKLAAFLSGILPGRSNTIVGRTNLANPKRAAERGYNYRLIEIGFISNSEDVNIFNTRMEDIAKGILECFGITVQNQVVTEAPSISAPVSIPQPEKSLEDWANEVKAGDHGNGHDVREASLKSHGCSYPYQEVRAMVNKLSGVTTTTKPASTTKYYAKYAGGSTKLDEVLEAIKVPAKYRGKPANRKPIAVANGISNYTGSGPQNLKLVKLAKQGKLIKP